MSIDSVAARLEGPILLLGRLAIGALYVPSGFGKLTNPAGFAQYAPLKVLPGPLIAWAIVAALVEFFSSLAIVLGFKTRYAALLLGIFTLIAAFLAHAYWNADASAYMNQRLHFWKDIAIVGGLLFVFVRGAGPISIDRR
jgi:putative oxidoreductase